MPRKPSSPSDRSPSVPPDRSPSAPADLGEYRRKRDFARTTEPRGGEAPNPQARGRYFIHKHAARRLHYDLRLELDGVLLSWAVPKGPNLDPEVRSLAVRVEDHPLEYGDFEGIIPKGEYGGGTVMLWDRGTWRPKGDPRKGLEKGHLEFTLRGEKLAGRWHLVRMGGEAGEDGRNWLLIKSRDAEAVEAGDPSVLDERPLSVATGRSMDEIAADRDRVWTSEGDGAGRAPEAAPSEAPLPEPPADAPLRPLPPTLRPQLPTLVSYAPRGDDWLHELKFDGYRFMVRIEDGGPRLITRRGFDWTERFPTLERAVDALGLDDTILDGEVVVPARDGTTDFQALQNLVDRGEAGGVVLYLFDLPWYRGHDLTGLPLFERKELLREVLRAREDEGMRGRGTLRFSDHIRGEGPRVASEACKRGIEGIVSKRAGARYREGRTRTWTKVKCLRRQEFVIGGWTEPSGARAGFGALLVGFHEGGRLRYAGRVGTGFTQRTLEDLSGRLETVAADAPPFANPPTGREARGVHWVEPRLVAEVAYGSWTDEGLLRHASFQGLREDEAPEEVTREVTREMPKGKGGTPAGRTGPARVAGVRLSNPGRVLYPEQGLTKRDLARYYEAVAEHVLPHVVDRPLTLVRCPQGREGECFYQKHLMEGMPEAIRPVEIEEKGKRAQYVGIADLEGLVSLVQFGVLEIHPWGSRTDRLDRPDRLVFDLDPGEGVGWPRIREGAHLLRERLKGLGLVPFLRTTGGKGLHLVVPLVRRVGWDEAKGFARDVARGFARRDPKRFIATAGKAERAGRIYVDWLRNARGATAIASYSTRARAGAPVAVPLGWDELDALPRSDHYNVQNVPGRLAELDSDPWEGFFDTRQSITREMREEAGGR
jgi:bifunctional non-homologous end joining protein LigD